MLGADDHTAIAEGDVELARSCGKPIPEIETNIREVTGSPKGEFRVRGRSVLGSTQTRMVGADWATSLPPMMTDIYSFRVAWTG